MPWLGARARGERVAVLRVPDQRAGRIPQRCVKSGFPTERVATIHAPALARAAALQLALGEWPTELVARIVRKPSMKVVIPVAAEVWRRWRVQIGVVIALAAAGLGFLAVGIATAGGGAVLFGALLLVIAACVKFRATAHWWVGARWRPERDEIVISRVSAGFEDGARTIYVRSVSPRSR